jgi:RNA polymerase sigma-70 factor (ECF subfamily)
MSGSDSAAGPTEEDARRWYPRLFQTALRLTGQPADAADLAQQAFLNALARWDRFDETASRGAWLHAILVNCVRDWVRRRKVRSAVPLDEWGLAAVEDAPDGGAVLANQEELAVLRRAVDGLTEPLRRAFLVTVIDGYTYQDAAGMLGVPVGTIASRVHQARSQVRGAVLGAFGEA